MFCRVLLLPHATLFLINKPPFCPSLMDRRRSYNCWLAETVPSRCALYAVAGTVPSPYPPSCSSLHATDVHALWWSQTGQQGTVPLVATRGGLWKVKAGGRRGSQQVTTRRSPHGPMNTQTQAMFLPAPQRLQCYCWGSMEEQTVCIVRRAYCAPQQAKTKQINTPGIFNSWVIIPWMND